MDTYTFTPSGVCAKQMEVKVENDIVMDLTVFGGCNGNLKGISSLVRGLKIDEVIERLSGIRCGMKDTSCPDQIAKCLLAYKSEKMQEKTAK